MVVESVMTPSKPSGGCARGVPEVVGLKRQVSDNKQAVASREESM